jgi:hypothetical protein
MVGSWALTATDSSVAEAIISKVFAKVSPTFDGMVFALLYDFSGWLVGICSGIEGPL